MSRVEKTKPDIMVVAIGVNKGSDAKARGVRPATAVADVNSDVVTGFVQNLPEAVVGAGKVMTQLPGTDTRIKPDK